MITNVPKSDDFKKVAGQCLTQSLNLLFNIYNNYYQADESIHEEVELKDVWKHNYGTLRTCIILLHQGIETFLKSEVCKTSPLLLIEKKRQDWPTLPNRQDQEFDSLYTISGEALLATFCAVPKSIVIDEKHIKFIEEIRKLRNKAIHGVDNLEISASKMMENILLAFTYFFGKSEWFHYPKAFNFENPLFGYFDWDYEDAIIYEYLDMGLNLLGRKGLNRHLKVSITGRPYFCPACKRAIEDEGDSLESKWAFLKPNKPSSTNIHCVNCNAEFKVERVDCKGNECKGNVIQNWEGEKTCLICFELQE